MKKSIILFELIISILILSVVGVYSLLFIKNLYTTHSQNIKLLNSKLDFQTTALFIENLLQKSLKHHVSSNTISFYPIDTQDLNSDFYSGFALLEKSSKAYVYTPLSQISKVSAKYIWFDTTHFYEITQSFEDNKIYFKNHTQSKRVFEHYKLTKELSRIYLKQHTLYMNDSVLLTEVQSFNTALSNNILTINICTTLCEKWIISL